MVVSLIGCNYHGLVLSVFETILLFVHHSPIWTISAHSLLFNISIVLRFESSAYMSRSDSFGSRAIYIMNNSGLRIEPCGTPDITGRESDTEPLNLTTCCQSVKYDLNH